MIRWARSWDTDKFIWPLDKCSPTTMLTHISNCAVIAPFLPIRGQKRGKKCFREDEETSPFRRRNARKSASIPNWNGFGVRRLRRSSTTSTPLRSSTKAKPVAVFFHQKSELIQESERETLDGWIQIWFLRKSHLRESSKQGSSLMLTFCRAKNCSR